MTQTDINILIKLITAYWTPERLMIWDEYEKTDKSVPFREFEKKYKESAA